MRNSLESYILNDQWWKDIKVMYSIVVLHLWMFLCCLCCCFVCWCIYSKVSVWLLVLYICVASLSFFCCLCCCFCLLLYICKNWLKQLFMFYEKKERYKGYIIFLLREMSARILKFKKLYFIFGNKLGILALILRLFDMLYLLFARLCTL